MLQWFVDPEVANATLTGKKVVEECEVEVRPNRVSCSCLDENVLSKKHAEILLT